MLSSLYKRRQIGSIPHYQRRGHFLNTQEIAAYTILTQSIDDSFRVFPKVPLGELIIKFKPHKDQVIHWSRVQLLRIDFLVCAGPELEPILAIKMMSPSSSAWGKGVVEDVLGDIALPLLLLRAQDDYDRAEVTRRVNLAIQEHQSAVAIRAREESVLDASKPGVDLEESTNSVLSSSLRFLTGIKDKYRMHIEGALKDPPN